MYAPARFCWDDPEKGRQEVAQAFSRITKTHRVDTSRALLGGFSQGGALAISMALEGKPVSVKGFVGIAPAFQNLKPLIPLIGGAVKRGVKGYLITGDRDPGRRQVEQLYCEFEAKDLPCKLEVRPNLGHDYPRDFAAMLPGVVQFLLS